MEPTLPPLPKPPRPRRKIKAWSYSAGHYGCRVRVFLRTDRRHPVIYLEERLKGRAPRLENLHHADRQRAKVEADRRAARLMLLRTPGFAPTLGATIDLFIERQRARAGELASSSIREAERAGAFWKAALGEDADPTALSQDAVDAVVRRRRAGALDARGAEVAEPARHPVRASAVGADLAFLRACLRWATLRKRLFTDNVMQGFEIPDEVNPRRPVATAQRYLQTRSVADQVTMEVRTEGKHETVTSWIADLLDLAYATGRRIGAIVALAYRDLQLEPTQDAPHGAIQWPADTDKMERSWGAPLNSLARQALDRILVDRLVGLRARWPDSPWCFPNLRDPTGHLTTDTASFWLERAEALAKLPKLDGSLWHAYRRGWATARKAFPLSDVAALGGWKDKSTLLNHYMLPDPATLHRVVEDPLRLIDRPE